MRRLSAWAGAACLAAASSLAAQTSAPQRKEPEVRRLAFHGVNHVDVVDLSKSVATQESRCKSFVLQPICMLTHSPTFWTIQHLNPDDVKRDVLRIRVYYWIRGYRNTQVDTVISKNGSGVNVVFNVNEGPPTTVAALHIEYDSTLVSDRQRRNMTFLKSGAPLDLVLLDSMRVLFLQTMWDKGHADAVVDTTTDVDTTAKRGTVIMRVIPGWTTRVGAIEVNGNARVNEQTIRDELTLHTGSLYRRTDVLRSERNLYESNLFRMATIGLARDSVLVSGSGPSDTTRAVVRGDSIKNLRVNVIEAPSHGFTVGAGFNTVDFLQLQSTWVDYDFFGDARRLDVNGTVGNIAAANLNGLQFYRKATGDPLAQDAGPFLQPTWSASMNFNQPAFLQQANALGAGVFADRRSQPGVYIDQGYGATATFTRNLSDRAPVSLTYRYEISHVTANDVYFCADYGMCDTATIGALRTHQSLSPIALTAFIDRTDQPFAPTTGFALHADLEHASGLTGSDYRYNRAYFDGSMYLPLVKHGSIASTVLALHLEMGAVQALSGGGSLGILHPSKRFYAGGSESVRGFGENQLGPRILTIDTTSLRYFNDTKNHRIDTLCAPSIAITQCNPNAAQLGDGSFQPRPLGGTSLIEGTIEVRFPMIPDYKIDGAVFIDGAVVGESQNALQQVTGLLQGATGLRQLASGTGAITPGFGGRYMSNVGMIRVDVGLAPTQVQSLTVVTTQVVNGQQNIVPLAITRRYTVGSGSLLNRLTLHLSIGQAF